MRYGSIHRVPGKPATTGESHERTFQTGEAAPETGIYRVIHVGHRLPHEVVVLKNERFPRCAKCKDAVLFDLIHPAPDLFQHVGYRVYELPVLNEAAAA